VAQQEEVMLILVVGLSFMFVPLLILLAPIVAWFMVPLAILLVSVKIARAAHRSFPHSSHLHRPRHHAIR
jgi:hypothetical protein